MISGNGDTYFNRSSIRALQKQTIFLLVTSGCVTIMCMTSSMGYDVTMTWRECVGLRAYETSWKKSVKTLIFQTLSFHAHSNTVSTTRFVVRKYLLRKNSFVELYAVTSSQQESVHRDGGEGFNLLHTIRM